MAYRIFTSERLEFERSHLYRRAMEIPSRTISNGINRSPAGHATQDAPPRYAAIKQSISNAVRDGSLKPDDRVPSEAELVAKFDVSRMTANRELRELRYGRVNLRPPGRGRFNAE